MITDVLLTRNTVLSIPEKKKTTTTTRRHGIPAPCSQLDSLERLEQNKNVRVNRRLIYIYILGPDFSIADCFVFMPFVLWIPLWTSSTYVWSDKLRLGEMLSPVNTHWFKFKWQKQITNLVDFLFLSFNKDRILVLSSFFLSIHPVGTCLKRASEIRKINIIVDE